MEENLFKPPYISLFPNPAYDMIEIPNPLSLLRNVSFFDARGSMVLQFINTEATQFNINNLSEGNYFLLVDHKEGKKFGNVLKLK